MIFLFPALVCLFVMVAMTRLMNVRMYSWSCPQCKSRNGKHASHCTFKKFDE